MSFGDLGDSYSFLIAGLSLSPVIFSGTKQMVSPEFHFLLGQAPVDFSFVWPLQVNGLLSPDPLGLQGTMQCNLKKWR